jgi:VWFA-related protein
VNWQAVALSCMLTLPAQEQKFETTAREVVLDLIVRDQKGRFVRDLKLSDIEVLENGVLQQPRSIRLVRGAEAIDQGKSKKARASEILPPGASAAHAGQARLIVVAFDRLGQDGRRLSWLAAQALLASIPEGTFVSVVSVDPKLRVVQQFTDDRQALWSALSSVTGAAGTSTSAVGDALKKNSSEQAAATAAGRDPSVIAALPDSTVTRKFSPGSFEVLFNQIMTGMDRGASQIASDGFAVSSLGGLLAILDGLQAAEGRKSVIYFCEGLSNTQQTRLMMDRAVGYANRTNVSFYGVDARGLSTEAQTTANRAGVDRPMATGLKNQTKSDADVSNVADSSQRSSLNPVVADFHRDDTRLEAMTAGVQQNLQALAEGTGGFMISDTNDFRPAMKRVLEESGTYYEVTYRPVDENWDGRFRSIEVQPVRSGLHIQSRRGYYAMPSASGGFVAPEESPMIRALATPQPGSDFEHKIAVYRLGAVPGGVQTAISTETRLGSITPVAHPDQNAFSAKLACMFVVRDENGNVVARRQKQVPFSAPMEKLQAFQSGSFNFTEKLDLPPGKYNLDSVVMDGAAKRFSVQKTTFQITRPAEGLSLSDLMFARRFDESPGSDPQTDLLLLDGKRASPLLRPVFEATDEGWIGVYFVATPGAGATGKMLAEAVYGSGAQAVRGDKFELPPPGADGRVRYVLRAPTSEFRPGQYKVRISVTQGSQHAEREASFQVTPPLQPRGEN